MHVHVLALLVHLCSLSARPVPPSTHPYICQLDMIQCMHGPFGWSWIMDQSQHVHIGIYSDNSKNLVTLVINMDTSGIITLSCLKWRRCLIMNNFDFRPFNSLYCTYINMQGNKSPVYLPLFSLFLFFSIPRSLSPPPWFSSKTQPAAWAPATELVIDLLCTYIVGSELKYIHHLVSSFELLLPGLQHVHSLLLFLYS